MTAININQVSKHFKIYHLKPKSLKEAFIQRVWNRPMEKTEFWALQDITLQIDRGQTIGIIGTNGSGKSTLLKLMAGILTPTKGNIQIKGQLAALLELGAGFHPDFSGRENILINGVMLGLSKKEIYRKMDAIIEFAELGNFIDNPVKTYSSGMYMRLGFSIAVNIHPDILLIDEVLAVGDYYFQKKCFQKMDEFKKNNKTIILVSHDLPTVEQFCTRIAWLHQSQLMAFGPVKNVLSQYMDRLTEERKNATEKEHSSVVESMDGLDESVRWGSREIEITGFRILGHDSREKYLFNSGEPVSMVIDYYAREEIVNPVFAIGIYRSDGVCCYGTNTGLENIEFGMISKGPGKMIIKVDRLNFVEGKYFFDLAVQSPNGHYYDFHYRLFSMVVNSSIKDTGVYRLPHQWILEK